MKFFSFRFVAFNDTYEFTKFPIAKVAIQQLKPRPDAIIVAGDFLSPSVLSSIDKGRSMIDMMNRLGVTHCCFGNHEADLPLETLRQRIKESKFVWLNANMPDFPTSGIEDKVQPYELLGTRCGSASLALVGLIGDDKSMFRTHTFKGVPIEPVVDTALQVADEINLTRGASFSEKGVEGDIDFMIPVTHQSMGADLALGELLQESGVRAPVIIGGHDHEAMNESCKHTTILKAGSDLATLSVIDIHVSVDDNTGCKDTLLEVQSLDLSDGAYDAELDDMAQKYLSVIAALEEESVLEPDPLLSLTQASTPDSSHTSPEVLSSEHSRLQQTTVGALFGDAVRSELGTDLAFINGATIMGSTSYPDRKMTLKQLRKELPFPTKMVTVSLPGSVIQDALSFSRTNITEKDAKTALGPTIERRGYLQMDGEVEIDEENNHRIISVGGKPFDPSHVYSVALPRNLLAGFCEIKPLMEWAESHKDQMPEKEAFIPAFNLVLSFFMKERWRQLHFPFEEIDTDHSGTIDKEELVAAFKRRYGKDPPMSLVNHMFDAADTDGDGSVDREEFEALHVSVL